MRKPVLTVTQDREFMGVRRAGTDNGMDLYRPTRMQRRVPNVRAKPKFGDARLAPLIDPTLSISSELGCQT